jgi:hypothetical protein
VTNGATRYQAWGNFENYGSATYSDGTCWLYDLKNGGVLDRKNNVYRPHDCPTAAPPGTTGIEPIVIFKHNMPLMKRYETCVDVLVGVRDMLADDYSRYY